MTQGGGGFAKRPQRFPHGECPALGFSRILRKYERKLHRFVAKWQIPLKNLAAVGFEKTRGVLVRPTGEKWLNVSAKNDRIPFLVWRRRVLRFVEIAEDFIA
jgi:hypothetical protein